MDLQQFAEQEIQIATGKLLQDAEKHKQDIKRQNWRHVQLVLGFLGLLSVGGYWGGGGNYLKTRTQEAIDQGAEQIRKRIDAEFQTVRIRDLMTEVAENEARGLLHEEVKPEVDALKKQMAQEMGSVQRQSQERLSSFEQSLQEAESRYQEDYKTLSARLEQRVQGAEVLSEELAEQVNKLTERNRLTELADDAILTGNRSAYDELQRISRASPSDAPIAKAAKTEVFRLKIAYLAGSRIEGTQLRQDGKPVEPSDLNTCQLLEVLSSSAGWRARAVGAKELGNRKEKDVPESLLKAIQQDTNLSVVKHAVESFRAITRYRAPDVFGVPQVVDWWKQNSHEVEDNLEDQTCEATQ